MLNADRHGDRLTRLRDTEPLIHTPGVPLSGVTAQHPFVEEASIKTRDSARRSAPG